MRTYRVTFTEAQWQALTIAATKAGYLRHRRQNENVREYLIDKLKLPEGERAEIIKS